MSVYKPKGATLYKYDFQRSGQRFSGSTGETGQRAAQAVERRLIAEVEDSLKAGRRVGLRGMTMDAAADRYWTETAQHTASPEKLGPEMKRLVLMVGPHRLITDISDEVVAGLVAKRRQEFVKGDPKRGLVSPAQVNRTVTQLLRRILTRAKLVWKVALPNEPHWRAHMLKEPTARVRELRHDEEAKLEAVEREDYRAPRVFAQLTGLRRREVASLTWPQVDFTNGTISVVGKGDKPHVLPITDELYELLAPLQGHHPEAVFTYVAQSSRRCPKSKASFVRGQRYPVTYEGLGTQFGRAAKGAGLKGLRLHDLRHTAATRTLRATGNLRLVQQMLAHSSPTTTAKYAHASLDDMREGMAKAASDSLRRRATLGAESPIPAAEVRGPIHYAITAHRLAWEGHQASIAFLDATGQEERKELSWPAQDAVDEAVADLLSTPCGSPAGAEALVAHLQWYLAPRSTQPGQAEPYCASAARVRAADLLMLLGKKAPASSSPIRAATDQHQAAWGAFKAASRNTEGWDEEWWSIRMAAQSTAADLLEVPCGNSAGAHALLAHLQVFTIELAAASDEMRDGAACFERETNARLADLAMFLEEAGACRAGAAEGPISPSRQAHAM